MEDKFTPVGYYRMEYHCSNCGRAYTEIFERGKRASQGECTYCGVEPIRDSRSGIDYE